jgi:hypothetical protein
MGGGRLFPLGYRIILPGRRGTGRQQDQPFGFDGAGNGTVTRRAPDQISIM